MKKVRKKYTPARVFAVTVPLVVLGAVIMARSWAVAPKAEALPTQTLPPAAAPVMEMPSPSPTREVPKEEQEARQVTTRYANFSIAPSEREELAAVVYLEAANQSAEGQQAVAEVILNRVISTSFPDNVHDVLHQGEESTVPQFSTICNLDAAEPGIAQYAAIDAALYGPPILPDDVVFFSRGGENDRVWGTIGDHVFCYAYVWE